MNGVILIVGMIALTFGFCFLLSYRSKRQNRDLFKYLILLTLYSKGRATEANILFYLRWEIAEVNCRPTPILKEKNVSQILRECLAIKFITKDDSKQPFLFYELTEIGEIWTEDRMMTLIPSILEKNLQNIPSNGSHA